MKKLFTLLFIFFLNTAFAANYYFSALYGDDSRTPAQAQNPSTPWKSLSKLNTYFASLQPGDSVLLKSGEIFYGSITVTKSGSAAAPIVISAYGTGSKPVITSLITLNNWVSKGNGIWESYNASLKTKVCTVLLNGVEQQLGRYPNSDAPNKGYLTFESHVGTTSITDTALTSDVNWTGAEVVIRTRHWVIDRNPITSHSGNTIYYKASSIYAPYDNYGYFIQNDIKTLDKLGEWYYDTANKKLSVYFGSNAPTSYTVQATSVDNLINSYKYNNVVFDNLSINGANASAVYIKYGTNIRISNCDIMFSGENGVSAYFVTKLKIENCTVSNSNNGGIDLGYSGDYATIRNNKIINTSVFAGMGGSGDGKGIALHSNGNSSIIEYNEIINTGYIALNFNGDSTIVKNNFIDGFCTTKDDGGGIYTYTGPSNVTRYGRKIIGNIVINGKGVWEGTSPPVSYAAEGIYLDDNSSGIEITDNTIANLSGRGLFLNNARNLVIRNNTFYNNLRQFYASQYRKIEGAAIRNLTVKGNIFFSKSNSQKAAYFTTEQNDNNLIGLLDSNFYSRPIDDRLVMFNSYIDSSGVRVNENLDLEGWQRKYSKDLTSRRAIKPIAPYKLNSITGANKFANGTFLTSIKGVQSSSCTVSLKSLGQLDDGYLEVTPSASYSSVFVNVGDLKAGTKYILRYTAKGGGSNPMYLGVSLRKAASPYTTLTPVQYRKANLSASDNEIMFSSSNNETSAQIVFTPDTQSKYYLDNIQLYEADASVTNIDDSVKFVYNPAREIKTISLDGSYVDMKNNRYLNSVSLQPYQSAVLLKSDIENMAPTVAITSPKFSSAFTATSSVTISAAASDTDGSVTKVDFYNGSTLFGTDTASPYTFSWNNVAAGNYTITAKATDNGGLVTTSAAVAILVYTPNVAPDVSITSPAAGTAFAAPASVTIRANAVDTDGSIAKVDFYNNDTLIGTATESPYTFTWTNVAAGNYSITVKATDDSSALTTSAPVSLLVYTPNVPPSVSLTTSVAGNALAAPASVTIRANAVDTDGSVTKVNFYNNDTLVGTTTASPYTITLNNIAAGVYSITAKATDDSSAVTASAPVAFAVYNPNIAPSVNITSPVVNAAFAAAASVAISATAADTDGTITKVSFYNKDTLIGIATASPYTITWSNVPAGNYSITAKATDDSSAVTTSAAVAISVYTPNIAPAVSLTSPVSTIKYIGPATISISASATDADGKIGSVKFYNGSTYLTTVFASPYTYAMTNVAAGTYTITAIATDDKGLATVSAPVTVTVAQNVAPAVSLTSPVVTTKYIGPATINMSATASDVDGTISSVKFYNGTVYLKTVFTSPYTYSMTNAAAGTYIITAKATDNKGAVTVTAPVTITVLQNTAPSVSITSPAVGATYTGPATIGLSALASDKDGSVSKVEFYNGSTLIASKTYAPYTWSWLGVGAGTYTITAKATDNKGAVTTSQSVVVTVKAPVASRSIDNAHAINLGATNGGSLKPDVKVFPNPAVSKLQLRLEGLQLTNEKANLSITNPVGIIIKTIPVILSGNTAEMDVTSLAAGIYIVTITADNFVSSKSFIKN